MLSIRLSRVGRKKAPTYRVVVMPKHRDPYGKVVEILGHYNPRSNPKEITLKVDRIKYWISQGAQPTDTVTNLLISEKIIEGEKKTASHLSKKRTGKIAGKETEAKEKAEAAKAKKAEAEEAAKAEAEVPAEKAPTAEAAIEETPVEAPAEEKPAEEEKVEEAATEEKAE
jgi:small subunit ribosomal protein S16